MVNEAQISDIASKIATRKCVLFAGAGITSDSGGATWKSLVEYLKNEFQYEGPLTDNLQIISDLCKIQGSALVYEKIANRLKDAKIIEPISEITKLPWFSVFTTNYDTALEDALEKNQKLRVKTIVTGKEFELEGLPSEILCTKLMGCCSLPHNHQGSMVLSSQDLAKARDERTNIFSSLERHAANLSFLFVGYSFKDKLFLEILDRLRADIGERDKTYYAVFKNSLSAEESYLLKQYGVIVIHSDLKEFVPKLAKQVSLRNPEDFSNKRIAVGNDVIPIAAANVPKFLSEFSPVFLEDLQENIPANYFFKGHTISFKPFSLNWHFNRKEIKELMGKILNNKFKSQEPAIFSINGNPGTGRTFIILASIYELITKYRSIAIKIDTHTINKIPRIEELKQFLEEIKRVSKETKIKMPERVLFWAEYSLDIDVINNFKRLLQEWEYTADYPYPLILIYEDIKHSPLVEERTVDEKILKIDIDKKLSEEQKSDLSNYLIKIIKDHKFPESTEEEIHSVVEEEKTYLPILYRTLDPAKRSIRKIIQQEFANLKETEVKLCISFCSIPSCLNVDMPVAILKNALGHRLKRSISYPEIFDIATIKGEAFIIDYEDKRTNPMVSLYHPLVAEYLLSVISEKDIDSFLLDIAAIVDMTKKLDAEFIANLLIFNGVNRVPFKPIPFSIKGLETALIAIKKKQPVRTIIHHLARLYGKLDEKDEGIIKLLREGLAIDEEDYAFTERKENLLTTLGNYLWMQNKERLMQKNRNDPEVQEVLDILIKARLGPTPNVHPYVVHARILNDLCQDKKPQDKIALINEAIEVIIEALEYCSGDSLSKSKLDSLLIQTIKEIDLKEAENTAKELFEKNNNGTGYYTLALNSFYSETAPKKALEYLEKSIEATSFPLNALALKINILMDIRSEDYPTLLNLANQLSSKIHFIDSWKSAYHKAVIYFINTEYPLSTKYFKIAQRKAPANLERAVHVFWMENGHRKIFGGKISTRLDDREGRIFPRNIEGYHEGIFFDPRKQDLKNLLSKGLSVDFELGFSPRGPIAFEVRPKNFKLRK